MSESTEHEFHLAEPALVCRWRLAGRHVPLLNRHMRALSQRRVAGEPLTANMLGWVKQHIEWSLAEDATVAADGVLMLVVDVEGQAAMSSGAYEPLADTSAAALAARAAEARLEAEEAGVAPEVLCALDGGVLAVGASEGEHLCGAMTFVRQLAETRGCTVRFVPDAQALASGEMGAPFLVSDEHGVVAACGEGAPADASAEASVDASATESAAAPATAPAAPAPGPAEPPVSIVFLAQAFETLRDRAR